MKIWVQRWEESERGWGRRPDGYTLHMKREDIDAFLQVMRDREAVVYGGTTPDEYSRPYRDPYLAEISDEDLIDRIREEPHGIWGPTGNYPTPA